MCDLVRDSCADPGIFVRGGPGQSDKKSSDVFFCFFLVLSLFYRSQMVNFKEIYHVSFYKVPEGSNIFQGVQLFPGGVQLLIPYITCDFPGGSGPPVPPSGSALGDQSLHSMRGDSRFYP